MTIKVLIYAPKWRDNAAGIKVLYLLCDLLNSNGIDAQIVPINFRISREIKDLKINYISESYKSRRKLSESKTIVIYSETVMGNPLNSKNVIRYYLNYPGLLSENLVNLNSEVALPYSQNIYNDLSAKKFFNLLDPMFISSIKLSELEITDAKKEYISVYASKYRRLYGKPHLNVGNLPILEIFGSGLKRQSRNETLKIISHSKALISFENSAIVTEAILSRTPVYLVENKLTANPIASFELGMDGVRPMSEFGKGEILEGEFNNAERKFQEAAKNSQIQITKLIHFIETSHFFGEKNESLKIRHRFIRVATHKGIFFRVYLRRVLRRFWNASN